MSSQDPTVQDLHQVAVNPESMNMTTTAQIADNLATPPGNSASVTSEPSQPRKKSLAVRLLAEELKLRQQWLENDLQLRQEFLRRKYAVLAQFESDSDEDLHSNTAEHVEDWATEQNHTIEHSVNHVNPTSIESENMPQPINVQSTLVTTAATGFEPRLNNVHFPHATNLPPNRSVAIPNMQQRSQMQPGHLSLPDTNANVDSGNHATFASDMQSLWANNMLSNPLTTTTSALNPPRLYQNEATYNIVTSRASQFSSTHANNSPVTLIGSFLNPPPRFSSSLPTSATNAQAQRNEVSFQQQPLTIQQINTRHALPKELPTFSGKPEEWPIFSATYDWSTTICGFTDAENLIRLQKSLKGDAYNAVQHVLIHPSCVPTAISTLKLLFGQPEKILYSIKSKIKCMPPINQNRIESFTTFAISVKGLQTTIEAAGLFNELENSSLLQELIDKLPTSLQLSWGTFKINLMKENKHPNLATFSDWIYEYGVSASNICTQKTNAHSETGKTKNGFVHAHYQNKEQCVVCGNQKHAVVKCAVFLNADRSTRWSLVRQNNLCKLCLQQHSDRKKCDAKVCGFENCRYKHHALLHRYMQSVSTQPQAPTTSADLQTTQNTASTHYCNAHSKPNTNFLFKIMPIKIFGKNNKVLDTYAFFDEGSSISLIDQEIISMLDIDGKPQPLCLKWTSDVHREENDSKAVNIVISGVGEDQFTVQAHTVKELALPIQTLDYEQLVKYAHIKGLPFEGYKDAVPRLLIGIDNPKLMLPLGVREGNENEPLAVKTKLGWQIYGPLCENESINSYYNLHICECTQLSEIIRKNYAADSIGVAPVKTQLLNKDDERALKIFKMQVRQMENKHFECGLLWRYDNFDLPDSYAMAKRRLLCLEKKIEREPELRKVFQNTIENYLQKGYIRKATADELRLKPKNVWYLPIFVVFNKNKPGKARVVWDAAAKSEGVSLNCFLLKGPDLIASLPAVLFRFRQKVIAIAGDIQEMFHQVFIRPDDQHVQRFLWRENNQVEPEVYIMNVMIFGAACSPCISQFVKNYNAERFKSILPDAANAIQANHYVDDYLDSTDTITEAVKIAKEVKHIHQEGGFNIRNWCSNSPEFTSELGEESSSSKVNISGDKDVEKVLGIFWLPAEDVITFKLSALPWQTDILNGNKTPTKREILSIIMSIYDPLGLISNILIYGKILLQNLWREAITWDEEIPNEHAKQWLLWSKELPNLEKIKISRAYLKYHSNYTDADVQLHVFVDASENAYAAVCYLRICKNNVVECALVTAKARVAPLKPSSIPRLELMAAVIGVRLAKFVQESHTIELSKKIFWCDSTTVLSWIRSDSRRYHQFVALRVGEILESSEVTEWHWVPTQMNVADEATKWSKKGDPYKRWFNAPEFLYQPDCEWPEQLKEKHSTTTELKKHVLHNSTYTQFIDCTRFSKWLRLVRATAFVLRFINNLKKSCRQQLQLKGELTAEELASAEVLLYKQAQAENYHDEIQLLDNNKYVSKRSPLYKLSIFLDDNRVLKANSRIVSAVKGAQHLVLLHKQNYITALVIKHYHEKLYHTNNGIIINELRQIYCVPRMRATVKAITKNCQLCKIRKAKPRAPMMASLPLQRLSTHVMPFTFTGVDFFGPMYVVVNRHKEKRYGVLFTCLTIRAIHIEIAYSLTTSSCILAIRTFIARRGTPREFFSDNGTNFVGAEKTLREALLDVDKNLLIRNFTSATTTWNFNPPAAPHMGGAWERLVRSVKNVLYNIAPSRAPSDEVLHAMMAEVENIVNARPLVYIPIDNEQEESLTPNHFLLGGSNGMKPLAICDDSNTVLRSTWLTSQQYAQHFWKRWIKEYRTGIAQRSKWHTPQQPIKVGDLVVVVDHTAPRNVWLRGKILEVSLSKDGQVRKAKVHTSHGVLERPAVKLAVLEVARQKE